MARETLLAVCILAAGAVLAACGDEEGGSGDGASNPPLFSEDFEADPSDLEHDYPDAEYYETVDEMIAAEGSSTYQYKTEVFLPIDGSTVYGLAVYTHGDANMDGFGLTFDASGQTFDLSSCQSAEVRFTWGIEDLNASNHDAELRARAAYAGMGSDDGSYDCEGLDSEGYADLDTSDGDWDGSLGPFEVTCHLDYDCGYESSGELAIIVAVEGYHCPDCTDELNGAVVWMDDIVVTAQ